MRKLSIAFATLALITAGYQAELGAQDRAQSNRSDSGYQQRTSQRDSQAQRGSNQNRDWSNSWSQWWSDWWNDNQGSQESAQERSRTGVREFIRRHDSNDDGRLTLQELPRSMRDDFYRLDANNDGSVTPDEIERQVQRVSRRQQSRSRGTPVEATYVWILDANRGRVNLEDLQNAYATLRKIDRNDDGQISRDELRARREQVVSQWCDECFNRLDENDDGELSRNEAQDSSFAEYFDQADRNRDQMLTKSEIHRYLDEQFDSNQGTRQANSEDQNYSEEQSASRGNESTRESNRRR